MKISTLVQSEIKRFEQGQIKINDNQSFSQYQNIKRINCYINDKFLDRDDDAIFWNLSTPRIPHFSKNIDLDTKDFYPYGLGETSFVQNWLLKLKFYEWCRENQFAITLNDLSTGLATYGSIVWKKYKEGKKTELQEVRLENLYFDPKVACINESPVVELHRLNTYELREKQDVWDNVEKVIKQKKEETKEGELPEFEIWERWGEFEENDKVVCKWTIGYEYGENEVILWDEEFTPEEYEKAFPYYDFHVGRYQGRWQRIGVVERLYKLQERANRLVNENAKTTEIASLLLLRTIDSNTRGNVLEQAVSGQIINSADLQQIAIDNRGMNNFINELRMIEVQADRLCNTPEVISGESLPSGTPFRSMATLSNAAKSTFAFIRQQVGERIADILLDQVLPAIVKDWNKEDIIKITEEDDNVKLYDDAMAKKLKMEAILTGQPLDQTMSDAIDKKIEKELKTKGRRIDLPKNFFDFKFQIRINPTGESFDKAQQNDVMTNALMMVQANPAITNIPLFKQLLENNGVEWWKLTTEQMEMMINVGREAGQPVTVPQKQSLSGQVDSSAAIK